MRDPWRYACPKCGSRQVRRRGGSSGRQNGPSHVCLYAQCDARGIDPVDLATG